MNRRQFNSTAAGVLAMAGMARSPLALAGLPGVSDAEASQGLKTALERGAIAAVNLLGKQDGFLGDPKVRIPLPGFLEDAAKLMRALGQARQVEELEVAMNRAAEAAVPLARDLLINAVRTMTVDDAARILTGGDTSVTSFFETRTRAPLSTKFLPVVSRAVDKVGLADKYNRVAGKAAGMGLVKSQDADIRQYVTRKSLDGLYLVIGDEEKKLRRDPVGSGSAILRKVFGALK